jgi:hypothetical protein
MVLGRTPNVRITKQIYDSVKPSKQGIHEIISIEEKFDLMMENYVELETTLLSLGMSHLAFTTFEYNEMLSSRNLISRRIVNLLSSVRLYRDALPQHVNNIFGARHVVAKQLSSAMKDASSLPMPYRMMEAIRNYTQHQELPIEGISFNTHSERDEATRTMKRLAYRVIPKLNATEVSKRRGLSADVRIALAAAGPSIDPIQIIREAIEHIGTVHENFRKSIESQEKEWDNHLRNLLLKYIKRDKEKRPYGVAVGFLRSNGTISNEEYIVQDVLDYRKFLRLKNNTSANLSKRYVKW